jgi:hypothetical protein
MKMINLDRAFMAIGLITALLSTIYRFNDGFNAYGWPMSCAIWILTCWIKTERLQSLTKNK